MWEGLAAACPKKRLGDIGHAVQSMAEAAGFSVVREYVGHGIGRDMHEDPNVPNFGRRRTGLKLVPGMVLAIEPMVNMGTRRTVQGADGWEVRTRDGKPSVHFEKTVAITEDGPVILTTGVARAAASPRGGPLSLVYTHSRAPQAAPRGLSPLPSTPKRLRRLLFRTPRSERNTICTYAAYGF